MIDIEKLRKAKDTRQQVMIIIMYEMQSRWFYVRDVCKVLEVAGIQKTYRQVEWAITKMSRRSWLLTHLESHQKFYRRRYKQKNKLGLDYRYLYERGIT